MTRLLYEVATTVNDMIQELQTAIDALKTFIEFCHDPLGFARGRAEDKVKDELKPFTDFVGDVQDKTQLVEDVGTASQVGRVGATPTTGYDSGANGQLWEDAP